MSVEEEFTEENFMRLTRRRNAARVLAHLLAPRLNDLMGRSSGTPKVSAIDGQGWSNFVLTVAFPGEEKEYIVRLAEKRVDTAAPSCRSIPHFEKEYAVLAKLRAFSFVPGLVSGGIGTMPIELPGRGERLFAFMVEEKMPFQTAREKGKQLNIARALEQLGDLSRQIHSVPCQGYGLDFDSVRDAFAYSSFSSFMDAKMQSIDRSPISQLMKNWLMARANELRAIAVEPTLFHRDLLANPGNYLVDDEGNVRGIIDWEFAGSGAAFHFEIASMLYVLERDGYSQERIDHDLSAILRGYQMSLATYRAFYERDIETIVLMNSISAMLKFAEVQKNGTAAQEPWRKLFAERAEYRLAKAAAVSSVTCSG